MIEPTLFLGPPGCGKTTTLLDTVLMEMERGVPPDRIGFMTFTKRGVEEAVSRASLRFNRPRNDFRYFNTLHSAAFRHLGLTSSQVFAGHKVDEFNTAHGYDVQGRVGSDDGVYSSSQGDDLILFLENLSRITREPLDKIIDRYDFLIADEKRATHILNDYWRFKQEEGLFDFTDMITRFIEDNDPPRLEVLIIDEAQDLSEIQWAMVEILARHVKRLYIAGDDDQTIFTWAGASERFIKMPGYAKVLEQSYRVPIVVHALANKISARISNRRDKLWRPRPADGTLTQLNEIAQLDPELLKIGTTMLLSRTNRFLKKKLIPYCRYYGIPYLNFDNASIRPSYAVAIDAWCNLLADKQVTSQQVNRIYDLLPADTHGLTGVAYGHKANIKRLADSQTLFSMSELRKDYGLCAEGSWAKVFAGIDIGTKDYIQKCLSNGYNILSKPQVQISTIHRVKGGQADTVVLLSDTPKASDIFASTNQDEETRVFYTGVTRTYQDLIIVQPDHKRFFGGLFE
jgi:DNA helicase-2/ATP-dependent DNA helicase PcrA